MAFILGKQVVKDQPEFDKYAYGLTLPVQRGNTGYFSQAFTSYEQSKANLKCLLTTKQGERVMQPTLGSGLHSILFENIDDDFESKIVDTITSTTKYWLPYITIKDIEVDMSDDMKDRNEAEVTVQFTVNNEITLQEITFTVRG